jgi:hypothetical protein
MKSKIALVIACDPVLTLAAEEHMDDSGEHA